ncbi:MAG: alpha/beta hydrolase [Acidobacteria bacterium]|nr:alpha/beta hydrolase [Acidobacteriota bacterium]
MCITRINGVRLFWELSGETGDLLVLVHGSWGDHHNWDSVVPAFARSFRVLTYDRRGHSQSERPVGQGSVEEDVADLAALIENVGGDPAHIVGNSFGGSIVLRLAGERPDLFRSLIVHEPPLFRLFENEPQAQGALSVIKERIDAVMQMLAAHDFPGGARQFVETIAFGPGAWGQLPPELRETFVRNAPTWLDEMRDPEALSVSRDRLRAFSARALLTLGGQSAPVFPLVVRQIAQMLPQAVTMTFAGAGHVPHLSHPDEYVGAVTSFAHGAASVRG